MTSKNLFEKYGADNVKKEKKYRILRRLSEGMSSIIFSYWSIHFSCLLPFIFYLISFVTFLKAVFRVLSNIYIFSIIWGFLFKFYAITKVLILSVNNIPISCFLFEVTSFLRTMECSAN